MRNLLKQAAQPQANITTPTYIYGLVDPRNQAIRYIGKSVNPKARFAAHLTQYSLKQRSHKNNWINGLLKLGLKPELEIIDEIDERDDWAAEEIRWIARLRNLAPGYPPLTNATDGGEGIVGYRWTEEAKQRKSAAQTGVPMPPGTGAKISAANRGRRKTAEHRAHLGEGQQNRWKKSSEEERQKMLNNLRTPLPEEKLKLKTDRARGKHRPKNASSQYINVFKVDKGRDGNIWHAGCSIKNRFHHIGCFYTEEEAARARDRYVLKYLGENILLNFLRSDYADDPSEIVVDDRPIDKRVRSRSQTFSKKNSSGYMGVTKNGKNGWTAGFNHMGVRYRLGTHRTREEAARQYDKKAIELLGDTAVLNFSRSQYD